MSRETIRRNRVVDIVTGALCQSAHCLGRPRKCNLLVAILRDGTDSQKSYSSMDMTTIKDVVPILEA